MTSKDVNKEEEVDEEVDEDVDRVDEGEDSKALEVKMLKEKKRNKDMNSSLTVGEDTRLVKSEPALVLDLRKAWSEEARAAAAAARRANGGPSEKDIETKMGSPRPADVPKSSGGKMADSEQSHKDYVSGLGGKVNGFQSTDKFKYSATSFTHPEHGSLNLVESRASGDKDKPYGIVSDKAGQYGGKGKTPQEALQDYLRKNSKSEEITKGDMMNTGLDMPEPELRLDLSKAWSEEARAAAAAARKGGGKGRSGDSDAGESAGTREPSGSGGSGGSSLSRESPLPDNDDDAVNQASEMILQDLNDGGRWQAGPDDPELKMVAADDERIGTEMYDGTKIEAGMVVESDWNDTGDYYPVNLDTVKEHVKRLLPHSRAYKGRTGKMSDLVDSPE